VMVLTARFQADSFISEAAVKLKCDVIVANDGDYAVYVVGEALLMTNFKLLWQGGKRITEIELCSGFSTTIDKAFNASSNISKSCIQKAKYPLIDGTKDHRFRLAIAIAIGCDTLPKGVPSVGLASLSKLLETHKTVDSFLKALSETSDKAPSISALTTCLDALEFEPVGPLRTFDDIDNEDDHYDDDPDQRPNKWVFEPPAKLDRYLEDFAPSWDVVRDDLELFQCPGHAQQSAHLFICETMCRKCSECNVDCCRFCVVDVNKEINKDKKKCDPTRLPVKLECLKCLASAAVDSDIPGDQIDAMRQELAARNCVGLADASYAEILELYDSVVDKGALDLNALASFPTQPSSKLGSFETISKFFEFREGGRFVRDEKIADAGRLVELLDLLAHLVRYTSAFIEKARNAEEKAIFLGLPDILIDFCKQCRIDGGLRLMKRASRHCLDPKCIPLVEGGAKGSVILHEDSVGLCIEC